jgi:hypothetical protein
MDRPETISLLRTAHDEVIRLRREIASLTPKAEAYDTIAILARQSQTHSERGYGVDVAWKLEAAVNELIAEREAERLTEATAADAPTDSSETATA